jgi:hypothetical protein
MENNNVREILKEGEKRNSYVKRKISNKFLLLYQNKF